MNAKAVRMEAARMNFSEIVNRVRYMRERFVVKRHGKAMALIIPLDDLPADPELLPDHLARNLTEFAEVESRP